MNGTSSTTCVWHCAHFCSFALGFFAKQRACKSTPIRLKDGASVTLKSGNGATGGEWNGFPSNFLQIKQDDFITLFMYWRPLLIQNLARNSASMALSLQWWTLSRLTKLTSSKNLWFLGKKMGPFAAWGKSERSILLEKLKYNHCWLPLTVSYTYYNMVVLSR